jgi:5'-3' exonuclease
MKNKSKTLLVDATYLLKRSISGSKNTYVNGNNNVGIYTFITTLRKLINEIKANRVVLMWDGENSGKRRYLINGEYKANRKNKSWYNKIQLSEAEIKFMEKDKQSELYQKVRIQNYCEELFIRQLEIDEIEADDLIAYYVQKFSTEEDITLYCNDKDYIQLLEYYISLYLNFIGKPIDKDDFFMYFPYHYKNSLTIKIMCGDTSDNIKGIDGLGEDKFLKLFPKAKDEYMMVNDCIKIAKEIQQERINKKMKPLLVIENIINGKERFITNKKLMDLSNPLIDENERQMVEDLSLPLDDENRGSKNLIKLMNEDNFLLNFNGYKSDFASYVEPFYTIISNEKRLLKEYEKNNK